MRTAHAFSAIGPFRRSDIAVRMLRMVTGLVLAVFVTAHVVNHAIGVISIDAQEGCLVSGERGSSYAKPGPGTYYAIQDPAELAALLASASATETRPR